MVGSRGGRDSTSITMTWERNHVIWGNADFATSDQSFTSNAEDHILTHITLCRRF